MSSARTVAVLVAPGVHLLDLAGPSQVFTTATGHVAAGGGYDVVHVGEAPVVRSHQGVDLGVAVEWPVLGPRDLLVVPGWRVGAGAVGVPLGPRALERVAAHRARGGRVASVCTGAFALGAAGVLDGLRATTHHEVQDQLARRHPRTRVVPDVLFTEDDRVLTSAGIASGVDLALHLVTADHGPAVAARTARTLVVPVRRAGDAPQASAMLSHRDHLSDVVHRAQDVLDAGFARELPLGALAERLGVSERTLTRRFRAATGTTPLRYQQALRVERAEQLVSAGWSREAAAGEVGFTDARMLRRLTARRPATAGLRPPAAPGAT